MNDIIRKNFKTIFRFTKENGKYKKFKTFITLYGTKNVNKDLTCTYYIFTGYEYRRDFNDFSLYVTRTMLTINKSFELFKNYIITKYDKHVLEEIIKNIDPNFIINNVPILSIKNELNEQLQKNSQDKITILKILPVNAYIQYGFEWKKTKQGFDYWETIAESWKKDYDFLLRNNFNMNLLEIKNIDEIHFNDYTMSIHKAIGEDKSFEIFEKYIITEYGQPILDIIIDNMSINYMKLYSNAFIEKYFKEEFENLNDKIYEKLTKKEKINIFKQLPATGYMVSMFNWSKTTQGHEYWRNIYYKWIKYYEKNIILI